jgi:hypothetical protein
MARHRTLDAASAKLAAEAFVDRSHARASLFGCLCPLLGGVGQLAVDVGLLFPLSAQVRRRRLVSLRLAKLGLLPAALVFICRKQGGRTVFRHNAGPYSGNRGVDGRDMQDREQPPLVTSVDR